LTDPPAAQAWIASNSANANGPNSRTGAHATSAGANSYDIDPS
jgi:hypothetical protein